MVPPTRIFQCKNGHLICEPCKYNAMPHFSSSAKTVLEKYLIFHLQRDTSSVNLKSITQYFIFHQMRKLWLTKTHLTRAALKPCICPKCRLKVIGRATDMEAFLRCTSLWFWSCVTLEVRWKIHANQTSLQEPRVKEEIGLHSRFYKADLAQPKFLQRQIYIIMQCFRKHFWWGQIWWHVL